MEAVMTGDQGDRDFQLGEWLVQPRLNRLSSGDDCVQIEPKMMDVLVYLAARSGAVVSKMDITDAVWPKLFITESVITRAIAGLRRALGDDAREPRFIETISKRGYRLLPTPAASPAPAPQSRLVAPPSTPFVVGQWVRGAGFYGRHRVLNEILQGSRNWLWLLGTRRIGKTSVLKELELIADGQPELGYLPVFWDLQGAAEPADLHLDFRDALLDAEARLAGCGLAVDELADDDLFVSLGRLRRALRGRGRTLLLLCDEVEELLHLYREDPALLRKLRRALQSSEGIRSVLAASGRLWALADDKDHTSPFLDGFAPPLYLGTMTDREAYELIEQTQLPESSRPGFDDATVRAIAAHCGNHPYLMQILARHTLRGGSLDEGLRQLAADRSVAHFLEVDLGVLSAAEQELLLAVARGEAADGAPDDPAGALFALTRLGMVRRGGDGRLELPNRCLAEWLRRPGGAGGGELTGE